MSVLTTLAKTALLQTCFESVMRLLFAVVIPVGYAVCNYQENKEPPKNEKKW
jgi:hypothetical protein